MLKGVWHDRWLLRAFYAERKSMILTEKKSKFSIKAIWRNFLKFLVDWSFFLAIQLNFMNFFTTQFRMQDEAWFFSWWMKSH